MVTRSMVTCERAPGRSSCVPILKRTEVECVEAALWRPNCNRWRVVNNPCGSKLGDDEAARAMGALLGSTMLRFACWWSVPIPSVLGKSGSSYLGEVWQLGCLRAKCRCFTHRGSHQRVKLECVFPFPDGDARKTQRFILVRAREGPTSSGGREFVLSCT